MRPLLVLSLVILAVAALLFALFSIDGDSDPASPAGVSIAQPDAGDAGPATTPSPETVSRPRDEEPRPDTGERRAAQPGDQRQSVGTASVIYDNALTGTVQDPEGEPVPGARLTLSEGGTQIGMIEIQRVMGRASDEDRKTRTTTTDSAGRFRIGNLEPGNYTLVTKHEEFSTHRDDLVTVPVVGETNWDVTLTAGLILQGYVNNHEGPPIKGAVVNLSSSMTPALFAPSGTRDTDPGLSATTDETGYYRFLNITPNESWHISASAPGFGTQTKRNMRLTVKNGTHSIDFRLEPGVTLAGRVIAPDRSPIPAAVVRVIGYQQPQTLSARTVAGADGRFAIEGLVGGAYAMIVEAEGWGIERRNHIEAPTDNLEIEMTEQGSVMGRVIGEEGVPVTSFSLSLHQYIPQAANFGRTIQEKKFDSPDGSFALTGVTEGRYGVRVSAAGFASSYSEDFEVTQGLATTDVLVRMNQGGTITGLVLDAGTGQPVAGATVMTQDNNFQDNPLMRMFRSTMPRKTTAQKARTGKDGRFELSMLSPELYQVQVKHPSYPDVAVDNLRVVEGDATDMGTVRLQPGSTVRGTVYDSAGSPLPGSTVQLISTTQGQMMHIEGRTDSDGRFILRNVPEGSYKLAATRPSDDENPFQTIIDMKNSEILFKVARGQEYSQDLYLGG